MLTSHRDPGGSFNEHHCVRRNLSSLSGLSAPHPLILKDVAYLTSQQILPSISELSPLRKSAHGRLVKLLADIHKSGRVPLSAVYTLDATVCPR